MNSSGSSWNQEIFQNALANLDELSHASTEKDLDDTQSPIKCWAPHTQRSDSSAAFALPFYERRTCAEINTTQEDFSFSSLNKSDAFNQNVPPGLVEHSRPALVTSNQPAFTYYCVSLESSLEQQPLIFGGQSPTQQFASYSR